jgi:hypothetical protein
MTEASIRDFYTSAEVKLSAMKSLQSSVESHITPLIKRAHENGR